MKQLLRIASVLAAALCCGCAAHAPTVTEKKLMTDGTPAAALVQPSASASEPKDARPAVQYVVQLDVYQLSVPQGTISNNAAFWKRVSEDTIDIATRDVLYL